MQQDNPLALSSSTQRKPRVKRSKIQWQTLLNDYEKSSLTQQAFCKQQQISISSFHQWRKRLRQSEAVSGFIDISETPSLFNGPQTPVNENTMPMQVELELGRGIVLRVRCA